MTSLAPCSVCRRHVRVDEQTCPFCAAQFEPIATPSPAAVVLKLTRAALFAGAALAIPACSSSKPADQNKGEPNDSAPAQAVKHDAQPKVADAGVVLDAAPDAAPDASPDAAVKRKKKRKRKTLKREDVRVPDSKPPYGAPPSPDDMIV